MLQERYGSTLYLKLDNRLFDNDFNSKTLELFTKVYVLFSLFFLGIGDMFGSSFQLFYNIPNFFFNPPLSIARLFTGFPDFKTGLILDIVLHILYGCVFFNVRPGINLFLIFCLNYIVNALGVSFGKIDHNVISLILPLVLSTGYLIKENSIRHVGFIKGIYAFLIGFAFLTAGLPKLFSGAWLNIWDHAVKGIVVNYTVYSNPLSELLAFNQIIFNLHGIFWELADYFVVLFELLFVIASFSQKSFRYFLFFACLFHFGTFIFLKIGFFHHFFCYLLFLSWHKSYWFASINEKINNLSIQTKLSVALLFGFLAIFPNSLFYFAKNVLPNLWSNLILGLCGILFVFVFALNLRKDLKQDLKTVGKEIWQLWFAKSS